MLKIGLTGGIGSGKTFVEKEFNSLGIESVDADVIAREVVEPGQPALTPIAKYFAQHPNIILDDGTLNRPLLRNIIFEDHTAKQWIEDLLHPLIKQTTLDRLQAIKSPYGILVSPLLIESEQYKNVDRILLVDVPESLQVERATQRDKVSQEHINSIIKQQAPRENKLAHANDVIDNSQSVSHTQEQIEKLHQYYLTLTEKQ